MTKTFFKPADEREHKKANRGEDVPDYCLYCRRPMMEHYNGACPTNEEDNNEHAE